MQALKCECESLSHESLNVGGPYNVSANLGSLLEEEERMAIRQINSHKAEPSQASLAVRSPYWNSQ